MNKTEYRRIQRQALVPLAKEVREYLRDCIQLDKEINRETNPDVRERLHEDYRIYNVSFVALKTALFLCKEKIEKESAFLGEEQDEFSAIMQAKTLDKEE